MESTYVLNDISLEELCDINGGSTKAAAFGFGLVTIVCEGGAYIASKTGHPKVATGLAAAGGVSALAAAWCAMAPCL